VNDERVLRFGAQDPQIEIRAAIERDRALPSLGDARLSIQVRSSGFAGHNDLWVRREGLVAFAAALAQLDRLLAGEARLSSISPEELELTVRAVSSRGHLAVEGRLGHRLQGDNAWFLHAVAFGFEIAPAQVSAALRDSWLNEYVLPR